MKITPSEFEQYMENADFPLAVAVSGGPDSLALLLLAHALAQAKGSHVIAVTVDHGLRAESKGEANRVAKWARERGIRHVILDWVGDKPPSRLQEKARKARYSLLTQWCQRHQISTLLLGHHQQDQEETFWLRLSSGSGLYGLSGMKKRTVREGIIFLRPLLTFSKERLKATLLAHNQEWIEDPSNHTSRFFRGRLRHFLQEEGLSPVRLDQVMKKLEVDADFIQDALEKAIAHTVHAYENGYLTIKKDFFNELHPAIAKRLLAFLMQWFSNADYSPRTTQVAGVIDKINKDSSFTAGGIYWFVSPEKIFLFRENRAVKEELFLSSLQGKTLWDQRFWIDPQLKEHIPEGTILGPLGQERLNSSDLPSPGHPCEQNEIIRSFGTSESLHPLRGLAMTPDGVQQNKMVTRRAYPTLPALWLKGKLVAVPHLCYSLLECENDLRKFINLKPIFHDSLRFTI